MKKLFLTIVFMATVFIPASFAQDQTSNSSELLSGYYAIKDALVSGNSGAANAEAIEFLKIAADANTLPEVERAAVVKDASNIAKTKDLKKQREYFHAFSENMFALAKLAKLSAGPVYKAYCPMAKGSWLSNVPAIKNPYYGSAMLTCGKVVETIK